MAIQMRRGSYADFNGGSNLVDGEFGIVTSGDPNTLDGSGVYVDTGANVHRLLAEDDAAAAIEAALSAYSEGDYPDMQVGGLFSDEYIVDTAPYIFRPTAGGKKVGNRERDKLVGGTVAWNQMEGTLHGTYTVADVTATNNGNGSMTINGTATASSNIQMSGATRPITQGHCYLFRIGDVTLPTGAKMSLSGINLGSGTDCIYKRTTASTNLYFRLEFNNGTVFNNLVVWPSITDLTQMLGSTIADYVYTLEQATAGSGIAWLKKYGLIDDQYHAYSQGSLESVEASAHVTKDADDNVLGTYPLDSDLVLRGIPKLSNGNLYYDGDTYEWDGTVTRKYGYVDMGTLSWGYTSSGQGRFSSEKPTGIKLPANQGVVANIKTTVYVADTVSHIYDAGVVAIGVNTDGRVWVHDPTYGTDANAFKTAMSGVYLVYELATPTTESADPFAELQVVDPDGTEEYIDYGVAQGTRDFAVPVGHYTEYIPDLSANTINDRITALEDGTYTPDDPTATANVTSGKYFMVGSVLYKATASIAAGDKIVVGTNCTKPSIADALNSLS